MFDAPIDLAASLCGFNPNTFDRELDLVGLKVLKPMDLEDQPLANPGRGPDRPPKKPSFPARLLGWAWRPGQSPAAPRLSLSRQPAT